MNTADQTLFLIKTRGPQTAQQLAALLNLTSMGARKQLEAWQDKGMLTYEDIADKPGRPSRRWLLTDAGHARFPDRHAELTVQLIDQVRSLFGDAGLDKLIDSREQASERDYRQHLTTSRTLPERVNALVRARTAEGYMAEVEQQEDGSMLLIENHCPICAAAKQCQKFCRSELDVFQRVLGPDCTVGRVEHMLGGARRCVYLIRKIG
ncbi:Predicted transcriptional regulator, ArsR family [Duganella sacchari]|uniref:Predicted transcriptional regulator, ArsR family n=1 Tax=Duganella sacchari TaxID=551987 RepID=A0A1M7R711_9BURK|nr:metalloregulator ArsR/SmtB family transcription factor [Duganella sacchari]SHN41932.1 Predicted transcriptional regulator, ArsR family [Duganella sacchari]